MNALSREQVQDVDRRAVEDFHVPSILLMENAGRGAAELLLILGSPNRVVVCAGKGNNGGDGFVIARHLQIHDVNVEVLLFADPNELSNDAAVNHRIADAAGIPVKVVADAPSAESLANELSWADWIVDALLGTGVTGEVREPYLTVIEAINQASSQVFAVDLPSGLDCDAGRPLGAAVRADHTATFVAPKLGFESEESIEWTGDVQVVHIGAPPAAQEFQVEST